MALQTVKFDRPAYAPGDTMTVTVTGEWYELVNGTAHGPDGTELAAEEAPAVIKPVEFKDAAGREWQLVSNDGETAVFTAEA